MSLVLKYFSSFYFIFIFLNNFYFLYCLFLKIRLIKKWKLFLKMKIDNLIQYYFFIWKKIIYSFIALLYNCITLIIQEKCIKCTKNTRLPFVKYYNRLWVILLFFLSLTNCTHMSCTLFNSCMEIPILSPIMICGKKIWS